MLGVNSPREPITPEFSKEIRASLRRAMTGQLNEKECESRGQVFDTGLYQRPVPLIHLFGALPNNAYLCCRN